MVLCALGRYLRAMVQEKFVDFIFSSSRLQVIVVLRFAVFTDRKVMTLIAVYQGRLSASAVAQGLSGIVQWYLLGAQDTQGRQLLRSGLGSGDGLGCTGRGDSWDN